MFCSNDRAQMYGPKWLKIKIENETDKGTWKIWYKWNIVKYVQ